MPNKKAGKNAYFFFVLDMIPELRRRGLQVSGVRDAIPLCSDDWARLTPEKKQMYADKAKEWKNNVDLDPPKPRRDQPDKSDSLAVKVSGVLDPYREEVAYQHWDFKYNPYKKTEGLERKVLYILNIFSHGEMPSLCEQRFVPCEVGCVRYSLQDGILDSFHDFIDPGALPLGFRYHCQAGSAATHQIPITGFELANRDYPGLYQKLCEFVSPVPGTWTPVYCRNKDIYRIKWCIQWLADKARMENTFELMDIESLINKFFKNKLGEEPSKSSVLRLLDVVHWDYANNTRCKWHEKNDMWYCALASCKKITYCMSKALATIYGITITANHLPSITQQDERTADDGKTVILNAKRFQKQSMGRGIHSECATSEGAAGGSATLGMNGVMPAAGSRARGRGILRLLEEMPPSSAASSLTRRIDARQAF